MKNKEKSPWYINLMIFSLVPMSQIMLYFISKPLIKQNLDLEFLSSSLNMNNNQLIMFQVITILLYSIINFVIIYLFNLFIIKLIAKKSYNDELFTALVLGMGISNCIAIVICLMFKITIPQLTAIIQCIIIFVSYYYFTDKKDIKGTITLVTISILMSVLPSFVF